MWCVAEIDDTYLARMEDVLAIYERPLDEAEPVVCLDEKPVTLHADVRPPVTAAPGRIAKRDSEYKRCGKANVYCAVEPKSGRHFTKPTPTRSLVEFANIVRQLADAYPAARVIHLILDNLNIHRRQSLTQTFGEDIGGAIWDRFHVHYTPKHGSWLNQAEIEISLFSRQCLAHRRIPNLTARQGQAEAWNKRVNADRIVINWGFTRRAARMKFGYTRKQFRRSKN